MSATIGLNDHLYYNTGTDGSPTWVEITLARDVTVSASKGAGDVSKRGGGGFKLTKGTLIDLPLKFEIVTDPTHTNYTTLQGDFFNRTVQQFAVANAPIGNSGTTGWKFWGEVMKFEDKQPLDGSSLTDVEVAPTDPGANSNPTWFTI